MALACPPPAPVFDEAVRRGYMGGPGSCPNGYRPIMKRIMAVAGDVVTFDGTGGAMRVNGAEIPNSAHQAHDAAGRPLSPWAGGAGRSEPLGAHAVDGFAEAVAIYRPSRV